MKGVIAAVLNAWAVWVPILGGTMASVQTLWQLDLYLRVGLMLAGATFSLLAASHFLGRLCATRTGFPNAQQKAALRRKAWLSRGAIILATAALIVLVRVVFDLSAIQYWQPRDAAGDKAIIYASLAGAEQVSVSLPPNGGCLVGDLAGRAGADWIPAGLGTSNPGIIIRNFAFPEAVAVNCRPGTMTSELVVDALPPPPVKPLSGADASRWHSIFLIWGVLLCALGLAWFQYRSRASV
ncbi:hypothetical protein JP75_15525 [Devosia riboflavina]|uniref:Uncharacterized protein n=1 Tax=Devosia riboflavina TaxID=46914 RepID=A0A087M0F1_9HYPH|nr:hypothetical protein [Devosia riboflavina]KFL30354.1 hypothetical protein JP75_15525 [Devosia riboflavina]